MTSIPQVSRRMKMLFEHDAVELGRQAGLRQRSMSLTQLAWLLVLGWWHQPHAGVSALARFAGTLGLDLTKQTVDCHFTERTAIWLQALLQRAIASVVCGPHLPLPLLEQFPAVLVEDGSTICLPAALKNIWGGCGGGTPRADAGASSTTQAALKLTVRWDLLSGRLDGPHLQAGKSHDLASVLRAHPMLPGSVWIADLGYWTLQWLRELARQGVYVLMRYKTGIVLWHENKRLDLLTVLPQQVGQRQEWSVDIGADRRIKGARLLAERVPEAVGAQRQERIQETAQRHHKPVNSLVMQLAHWTLIVTTVPASKATAEQVFALLRARWQIELLFKLWKQDGCLESWSSEKPWAILCQVYAKLLAMVVQHWFVLLSCWDDPDHSLPNVAQVLRGQVPLLVHGLRADLSLSRAIRLMLSSVRGACSIAPRSTRLSTSRRLQRAWAHGLT